MFSLVSSVTQKMSTGFFITTRSIIVGRFLETATTLLDIVVAPGCLGAGSPIAVGVRFCGTRDPAILSSSFDALVTVLVERGEVLPKISILWCHRLPFAHSREFNSQAAQRHRVKFILV